MTVDAGNVTIGSGNGMALKKQQAFGSMITPFTVAFIYIYYIYIICMYVCMSR